jgi:hypothetical protein
MLGAIEAKTKRRIKLKKIQVKQRNTRYIVVEIEEMLMNLKQS